MDIFFAKVIQKITRKRVEREGVVPLSTVLSNLIKIQAISSSGRVKFI